MFKVCNTHVVVCVVCSTVEEDVSGFYEALDILKRRSNARK